MGRIWENDSPPTGPIQRRVLAETIQTGQEEDPCQHRRGNAGDRSTNHRGGGSPHPATIQGGHLDGLHLYRRPPEKTPLPSLRNDLLPRVQQTITLPPGGTMLQGPNHQHHKHHLCQEAGRCLKHIHIFTEEQEWAVHLAVIGQLLFLENECRNCEDRDLAHKLMRSIATLSSVEEGFQPNNTLPLGQDERRLPDGGSKRAPTGHR